MTAETVLAALVRIELVASVAIVFVLALRPCAGLLRPVRTHAA